MSIPFIQRTVDKWFHISQVDRSDSFVLVAEVIIERPGRNTTVFGNLSDGDLLDAFVLEQFQYRRFNKFFPTRRWTVNT